MVEIAVVITVISLGLISFINLGIFSLRALNHIQQADRANLLANEAIEAVRSFRDNTTWDVDGLGLLTVGTNYYPNISVVSASTTWELLVGTETQDGFSRRVVFDNVSRDIVTYDIEAVYNVLNDDVDTRKVRVIVAWGSRSIELVTYLTNW